MELNCASCAGQLTTVNPSIHKKRGKDTNYFDIFAAIGEKKSEFCLFSLVLKFFVIPVYRYYGISRFRYSGITV